MELQIKKIGKFKLLQKIARGGMAEIFLACSGSIESAHKFVVIKCISLMHSHSQEFNKMFQNEGKIAINLNHSNIGSIYEFGREKEQYFICMEYISGRNIRQLVKKLKSQKKQLSVECSAHIIKYVCYGLDYAHNCTDNQTGQPLNIIHRDVSPQNIMVSFSGDIKVIDFGIAKIDDSEVTKAGVLKGKFEYMSPEQARGKGIDKQTDVFSLGNVFWELLAGRKLFTGANEIQLLKKIRDCQIPDLKKINPQIPDKLVSIVNKALSANKHLRYKTVADMGNEISIFLNKHYPNFTNSHFSSFIKEVYIEEIMEERQQLKAYSQALKKSFSSKSPRINVNNTMPETFSSKFKGYTKEFEEKTQMNESTGVYSDFENTVSVVDKDFEEQDSRYTETETKSNMSEQKTELTKTKFEDPLDSKTNSVLRTEGYTLTSESSNRNIITTVEKATNSKSKLNYSPWHPPENNSSHAQQRIMAQKRKRKNKAFRRMFISVFVLSALSASYFFSPEVKNQVLNLAQKFKEVIEKDTNITQVSDLDGPAENQHDKELAHKTQRVPTAVSSRKQVPESTPPPLESEVLITKEVLLTTRPSGAQLYINGVKLNSTTPTSISIYSHQETKILIRKSGYKDKKVTLSPEKVKHKVQYSLIKKPGAKTNEVIIIR